MTTPDLDAIEAKWLQPCGSCDAGLPSSCAHPDEDYRPPMADLVTEVRRWQRIAGDWLRKLATVEAELAAARREAGKCVTEAQVVMHQVLVDSGATRVEHEKRTKLQRDLVAAYSLVHDAVKRLAGRPDTENWQQLAQEYRELALANRQEAEQAKAALGDEQREHREGEQFLALACHLADISAAVTGSYPAEVQAVPELVMRRRVNKIGNEYGEMLDAIEGWTGENPRKGVYATKDDVVKELLDCASASLCAVEHLTGDQGQALLMLARQVGMQTDRLRAALSGAGTESETS